MSKVPAEQAKAEITAWLDKKKVPQGLRDKYEDAIETLEEAIMDGTLVRDEETNELALTLLFPFEKGDITVLKFKPRINDILLRPQLKGVAIDDIDGRLAAIMATLTGQPKGIINGLDSMDKRIARSIANFFI